MQQNQQKPFGALSHVYKIARHQFCLPSNQRSATPPQFAGSRTDERKTSDSSKHDHTLSATGRSLRLAFIFDDLGLCIDEVNFLANDTQM